MLASMALQQPDHQCLYRRVPLSKPICTCVYCDSLRVLQGSPVAVAVSLGRSSSFSSATSCTHQRNITTITCYSTATLLTRGFLPTNRLSLSRCSLSSLYTSCFSPSCSLLNCFCTSQRRVAGTGWSALLVLNSSQTEEGLRRWYGSKGSDCVERRPIQHSL